MPPQAENEQAEDARLRQLLQTVFNAFLDFFNDRVDEYASDREVRIANFVKEEINLHQGEARERMKGKVDRLQQELDDPYIRHSHR